MLVDLSHFVVVGVVHLSAGVVDLSAGIVHLLSGFLSAVLEHVCLSPAIYIGKDIKGWSIVTCVIQSLWWHVH